MIWWTYKRAKDVLELDDLMVATDDTRIMDTCNRYDMKAILTKEHETHINRIQEVSEFIKSDLYLVVCGDEPLIDAKSVAKVIPNEMSNDKPYVSSSMRVISSPS